MICLTVNVLILLLFFKYMMCVTGFPNSSMIDDESRTMSKISIICNGNENGRSFNKSIANKRSESFISNNSYNNQLLSPLLIRQTVTYNIPISEVYALKTMYDALNGADWNWKIPSSNNGYKWVFDDAMTTINPCTDNWQGVTCDYTLLSRTCHITEIDLTSYDLDGYLSDMTNLTMIVRFTLGINLKLKGDLSPLSNTIALEYLGLDNTAITGDLSPLSKMTALKYLDLSYTTITGNLSPLSNMNRLFYLDLSNTTITGDLSPLSNMTSLINLILFGTAITGDLSPLSKMTALKYLDLYSNAISGDLSPLSNMNRLSALDLGNNTAITGDLSPLGNMIALEDLDLSDTAISGDLSPLSNMTALEYLDLSDTAISGDLSPLSNTTTLQSLDLGNNTAITGDLSPLSNMNRLSALYLYNTTISGDLSPLSGNMNRLLYLDLQNTAITGDLLPLVTLRLLRYCVVNENRLQGSIPSLRNMSHLVYLNVANNQLTGSINNNFPESLEILDLSNNQFTGALHASLFTLPNLQVLDASINCLSVQFTDDICSSSTLQHLLLDGLHSSTSCRQVLPIHIVDTIYATKLNVVSNIPACLYCLRNLQSLHMAGNGITGALPTNVTLSTSFKELVLANNRMHSTIPTAFQAHDWNTLDLSYNVFVGYLSPSLNVSNSLSLKVNRLSGNIPSSLSDTSDVSILTGNMFTCTSHQLAALHDEEADNYACGSDSFNSVSIVWLVVLVLVLLSVLVSMHTAYGEKSIVGRYINTSIGYLRESRMHRVSAKCRESAGNTVQVAYIQQIPELMKRVRQLSGILIIMIVCVYMPLYSVLTHYCGTYYNQYAWTVSVAFLLGEGVGIVLFVMYTTTLFVACYGNSTAIANSLIFDFKRKETKGYLVNVVVFAVNLVIILAMNGCYVYVLLHYGQTSVVLMEITLSVFKVIWTSYALVSMMRYAHTKYPKADSKPYEHVHFLTILSIVNSIVQPCLASALLDTNCFYNMMYSAESITSIFIKSISLTMYFKDFSAELYSTSSYSPSFMYSYQCSSILLTSYAGIFMYVALLSVLLPPALDYLKIVIKQDDRKPATNSAARVLLNLLKKTALFNSDDKSEGIIIDEVYMTKTIISLVGSISVLVTFGVMQPVLGFVTYLAIIFQTMYREYRVEQYVSELLKSASNASSLDVEVSATSSLSTESRQALIALNESVKGLSQTFARSTWQLLLFLGPFYGFFVFDIIGDEKGFEEAIWAPVALVVLCLSMYVIPSFLQVYVVASKRIALSKLDNSFRVQRVDGQGDAEMVSVSGEKHTKEVTTNPMNSSFNNE